MPGNTSPIFSSGGSQAWTSLMISANTGHVSGSTSYLAFTAGGNGSFVQRIRFRHFSLNALTSNASPTVARVWINNGADVTVAANSTLWDEITIAAMTYSAAAALTNYELPLNFALPANYRIYVTLGVAPTTNTAIQATVIGGNY